MLIGGGCINLKRRCGEGAISQARGTCVAREGFIQHFAFFMCNHIAKDKLLHHLL